MSICLVELWLKAQVRKEIDISLTCIWEYFEIWLPLTTPCPPRESNGYSAWWDKLAIWKTVDDNITTWGKKLKAETYPALRVDRVP